MSQLEHGFIELVDQSEWALYGDTDSSYSKIRIPFSKYDDTKKVVAFILSMSKYFNEKYLETFTDTVCKYGGVDPDYNMMFFKTEIVAYRGFFNTKKYYALAKLWDEGKFFDEPKLKKTGGQILKSDSSKIVFDLLTDVYKALVLDMSISDEDRLYRKVFKEIKSTYLNRVLEGVDNMDYKDFGIPKKWSLSDLKTIPKQVQGAMFFNYLFTDTLRPGDSVIQCQVKINPSKLVQYYSEHPAKTKYQIDASMISDKLNVISFPVDLLEKDFENVKQVFNDLDIKFDLDQILDFNVNLKLKQFEKLFKAETIRNNL